METFKRELWQSARILIIVLVLSVGVQYVYAWTGPTAAPPDGNVPAPINTSVGDQKKTGGLLEIFNLWINGALGVTGGASFGGNVGIGTASPLQKLSVAGTIESTSGGFKFPDGTTQTTATTSHGKQRFTSNETFIVPAGVTKVWITGSGDGGGGGGGYYDATGGGGGGAHAVIGQEISVTPGQQVTISIGLGGQGGATVYDNGSAGDASSFLSIVLPGGGGGTFSYENANKNVVAFAGGSGG